MLERTGVASRTPPLPPPPVSDSEMASEPVTPEILFGDHQHRHFPEDEFWRGNPLFAEVEREEFLSNKFQVQRSLSNATQPAKEKLLAVLAQLGGASFAEDVARGLMHSTMAVQLTPYVLSLIDWSDPSACPVRNQFLPMASKMLADHPMTIFDSLAERENSPVPGLVHRYFDRALFLPQATCPVYCRFCTRSYAIGTDTATVTKFRLQASPSAWAKAFAYIRATPQIEDVIISGGDVYNLHPRHLRHIADNLLALDSVQRIRIATKGLAVNPGRILSDAEWTDTVLSFALSARKAGKQVFIHTHINSPREITWITKAAARRFVEEGVVVRNQGVLLRGTNDSAVTMMHLIKRLGAIGIQPYYMFLHDLVRGVEDLRTSLAVVREMERSVRGATAGYNTPHFVLDPPGGGGKMAVWAADAYDRETGISVFSSPAVRPGKKFLYFDPLHSLHPEAAKRWQSAPERTRMCEEALQLK